MKKHVFNFISDLHLACDTEDLRPHMQCVHFKNGYAYASDAHILIKQPLSMSSVQDIEHLEGKAIHSSIFKEIRKMQFVVAEPTGFQCRTKSGHRVFYPYTETSNPPDFDAVIPNGEAEATYQIGFKPKLMTLLSKAMAGGNCGLKITLRGPNSAMVLEPVQQEYNEEIGLLMPTMLT